MRLFSCSKCSRGACPVRRASRVINGVKELIDVLTHEDGTKEKRVWAKIDVKTDSVLMAKFI